MRFEFQRCRFLSVIYLYMFFVVANFSTTKVALPSWLVWDPLVGTLSGTPPRTANGTFEIEISTTNSLNYSAETSFELSVIVTGALIPSLWNLSYDEKEC